MNISTRSQRLIHLSQEHASAFKLAMAVRNLAPEDESALPTVARQIRDTFQKELLPHFADEERYVVPRLAEIERQDLIGRMRAEHERLANLAAALAQPKVEDVQAFATLLSEHVCFEENVVWEILEPGLGHTFDLDAA